MSNEIQSIYTLPIGSQREHDGLTLTLTEDGWRADVQHSMHRRCKGWDYCRPWTYLITICTQHHDLPPRPQSIPVVMCSQSGTESVAPGTESVAPGTESIAPRTHEVLLPIPDTWHHPQWLLDAYSRPGRPHLFGELVGGSEREAAIYLNDFGREVERQVLSIHASFPQVVVIAKVVMPNHIHMVVRVCERLPEDQPLGYILDKFKSWVNRRYKEICLGLPRNTLMDLSYQQGGAVQSSAPGAKSTKRHGTHPKIGLVFEAGFNDRILFREGQLQHMIAYLHDNPRRLWMVAHNREYFHTICGIRLTMPLLSESGTAGRSRWRGAVEGLIEPIMYSQSQTESARQTITFTMVGNRALLRVPERLQIQCSRSMTAEAIDILKEEVLEACKHGVVPISPCISPGEKAVARAVMEAGYELIVLLPQGLPSDTTYKPYKQFFDACATGKLLMMSPWKFENGVSHVKRWQCLFLNDIALQLMVSEPTVAYSPPLCPGSNNQHSKTN